jgi:hypothetical protein
VVKEPPARSGLPEWRLRLWEGSYLAGPLRTAKAVREEPLAGKGLFAVKEVFAVRV